MPERLQQGQRQPTNQADGETTFLADVKEAFGFDPDQVVDTLGIPLTRIVALTRDEKNRAWAKIRTIAEGMPF